MTFGSFALGVVTMAVLLWVGVGLFKGAHSALSTVGRRRSLRLLKGIGFKHIWPAPIVATGVVVVFLVLSQVPVLTYGWWTLIGGHGNVVFGSTDATRGTVLEWLVPMVFIALLIPAMPMFVEAEERRFRFGSEHRSALGRVLKALEFGLFHLLVGIPIAAALALSLGGWYFTMVYLREYRKASGNPWRATVESTRAHLAYNLFILGVVAVAMLVTALGG